MDPVAQTLMPIPTPMSAQPNNVPDATDMRARYPDLTRAAVKVFERSGNHFFNSFRDTLFKLISANVDMDHVSDNEEMYKDVLSEQNVRLILRLWAGELKCPRKKSRRDKSLYRTAQDLLSLPVVLAAARAVCLALATEWVYDQCETRMANAENSEHWTNDDNEYVGIWESRIEAIRDLHAQMVLDDLARNAIESNLQDFAIALNDGELGELDCM
jgi:hypothetical protein